jgi:rusticyanin
MKSPRPAGDGVAYIVLVIILIAILLPTSFFLSNALTQQGLLDCSYTPLYGGLNYVTGSGTAGPFDGCMPVNHYVEGPEYDGTSNIGYGVANGLASSNAIPNYVDRVRDNNTLIFNSMNVTLLVFANANTWVAHVTGATIGQTPHSNVTSYTNAFAIYGLYNPTLIIPRGATLNITFINMDTGDHHNFVLTTFAPPFPEYIMQNMQSGGEMVAMTPLLNPAHGSIAHEFSYTVTLQVPSSVTHMWYMCMFPIHAMAGMWGNVTLVNPVNSSTTT